MAMKKVGLLCSALLLSSSVFAANLKTSLITIQGGVIKPRETFNLITDKLVPNVDYTLTCKIKDANNGKNAAYIKINSFSWWPSYDLNGEQFYGQVKLNQVDNTLTLSNVDTYSSVSITNLDNDDTVELVSCTATPSTY